MQAPPENANGACQGAAAIKTSHNRTDTLAPSFDSRQGLRANSPDVFTAIVEKGDSCQVRVTVSKWRGQGKVSVREFTPGAISNTWWPTAKGATIDVDKLPELIAALQRAATEARRLGLLSKGRAGA